MQNYIGTKRVAATPMTRGVYNLFRGWKLPEDECGDDAGYLVEYLDGGKPNMQGYAGYVSWSPKEQFDKAYRRSDGMSFGLAIEALEKGLKVARTGWNGKGMFLLLVTEWDFTCDVSGVDDIETDPFICMKTAQNTLIPWLASQADMLANDWCIVE